MGLRNTGSFRLSQNFGPLTTKFRPNDKSHNPGTHKNDNVGPLVFLYLGDIRISDRVIEGEKGKDLTSAPSLVWCLSMSRTASSVRSLRHRMSLRLLKISYLVDADFDADAVGANSQADDDKFVEFVARSGADIATSFRLQT